MPLRFLFYIWICLFVHSALADLYSDRPDILSLQIPAKKLVLNRSLQDKYSEDKGLDAGLQIGILTSFKQGTLAFLAELEVFYADRDIYFLGRDMEYAYDYARLLFRKNPKRLAQFHLINISRFNKDSRNLDVYLEQMGLTAKRLKKYPAVVVDSAASGTIIDHIENLLNENSEEKLVGYSGHMMVSAHKIYPQSLTAQDPIFGGADAMRLNMQYRVMTAQDVFEEQIPHYTDTSNGLSKTRDGLVPKSKPWGHQYSERESALTMMADIKYDVLEGDVEEKFFEIVKQQRILFQGATGENSMTTRSIVKAQGELFKLGVNSFLHDLSEITGLRKTIEIDKDNLDSFWSKVPGGDPYRNSHLRKFNAIEGIPVSKYLSEILPQFSDVILRPNSAIPKLEVKDISIVQTLINNGNITYMLPIIKSVLTKPGFAIYTELMDAVVLNATYGNLDRSQDPLVEALLDGPLKEVFWQKNPNYFKWLDLLSQAETNSKVEILKIISAKNFLKKKEAVIFLTELRKNQGWGKAIITTILSSPSLASEKGASDLFLTEIENSKSDVHSAILKAFLMDHWQNHPDVSKIFDALALKRILTRDTAIEAFKGDKFSPLKSDLHMKIIGWIMDKPDNSILFWAGRKMRNTEEWIEHPQGKFLFRRFVTALKKRTKIHFTFENDRIWNPKDFNKYVVESGCDLDLL